MDKLKISDLNSANDLAYQDMLEISQVNTENPEYDFITKKVTLEQLENKYKKMTSLGYYTGTNELEIGFYPDDILRPVVNVTFSPQSKNDELENWTNWDAWCEVQFRTYMSEGSDKITLQVAYVLNGAIIGRRPVVTFDVGGYHTVNLGAISAMLRPEEEYTFSVYMRAEGGTCIVDPYKCICVCQTVGG